LPFSSKKKRGDTLASRCCCTVRCAYGSLKSAAVDVDRWVDGVVGALVGVLVGALFVISIREAVGSMAPTP
jgi:hypothetical protein